MEALSNFYSPIWHKEQILNSLKFYYPQCIDRERGGYYHSYRDDGTVDDANLKHLVGVARFIYVFSVGAMLNGTSWCIDMVKRGIYFLQEHLQDRKYGGYYNELSGWDVVDASKQVYGHAHVLLAASYAARVGCKQATGLIASTFQLLEKHAWLPEYGLYMDEFNEDWTPATDKRGQNANMHLCEAMIAAYVTTGNHIYLLRAVTIAKAITCKLAQLSKGYIWENYNKDWTPDLSLKTRTKHGEYGVLVGHQTEWGKLLVILSQHHKEDWMIPTAEALFRKAVDRGWDTDFGGLYYNFDLENRIINDKKSWWVSAESIGASALLWNITGDDYYKLWYRKLWEHAWQHFVDHRYGAWFADLDRQHKPLSDVKSPFHKTDYHPIGAMLLCYNMLNKRKGSEQIGANNSFFDAP